MCHRRFEGRDVDARCPARILDAQQVSATRVAQSSVMDGPPQRTRLSTLSWPCACGPRRRTGDLVGDDPRDRAASGIRMRDLKTACRRAVRVALAAAGALLGGYDGRGEGLGGLAPSGKDELRNPRQYDPPPPSSPVSPVSGRSIRGRTDQSEPGVLPSKSSPNRTHQTRNLSRHNGATQTRKVRTSECPSRMSWQPNGPSEARNDLGDPAQALDNRVARGRVGDPDVPFARRAEGAPGRYRDGGLLEDALAEYRALDRGTDSREDVEGAVGPVGRQAVDLRELSEDDVAPRMELLHHGLQRGCRSAKRRDARLLGKRGGTGDRVFLDLGNLFEEGRRRNEPSQPPAGHRVRLRKAVHGHGTIEHAFQGCGRDVLAFVQNLLIDFVADYDQIMVRREIGEGLRLSARIHGARGIRG